MKRIFNFYYQGFKGMTVGKSLWLIIIIKLVIFFVIFKIFLLELMKNEVIMSLRN
jgi:uncharacterized membrane protein